MAFTCELTAAMAASASATAFPDFGTVTVNEPGCPPTVNVISYTSESVPAASICCDSVTERTATRLPYRTSQPFPTGRALVDRSWPIDAESVHQLVPCV